MGNMQRGGEDILFGDFVFQAGGRLLRHGVAVPLPPKERAVLALLLETAGEWVDKARFYDTVWRHASVGDESLTRCIYALRRLLGEAPARRFIETRYGRGYRFCHPVTRMPRRLAHRPLPKLAVLPPSGSGPDGILLHRLMIEGLARSPTVWTAVVPAVLTRGVRRSTDIVALVGRLGLDYYVCAEFLPDRDRRALHVELVQADSHCVAGTVLLPVDGGVSAAGLAAAVVGALPTLLPDPARAPRPASVRTCLARGWSCLRAGRPALALPAFRDVLRRDPRHAEALWGSACAWYLRAFAARDPRLALAECGRMVSRLLSTDPGHAGGMRLSRRLAGEPGCIPLQADEEDEAIVLHLLDPQADGAVESVRGILAARCLSGPPSPLLQAAGVVRMVLSGRVAEGQEILAAMPGDEEGGWGGLRALVRILAGQRVSGLAVSAGMRTPAWHAVCRIMQEARAGRLEAARQRYLRLGAVLPPSWHVWLERGLALETPDDDLARKRRQYCVWRHWLAVAPDWMPARQD